MDNEDITNAKTATLQRIIKTYKELNNIETTHYYLKDKNTTMPAAFNDIKTIDILNYGQVMEMLVLLDEHSPKKEVQKVKNYTIYETTYDNVIVYYTIKDKKQHERRYTL